MNLLGNSIFLVNKGQVTPYDGYPDGKSRVMPNDVITSDIDVSGFITKHPMLLVQKLISS